MSTIKSSSEDLTLNADGSNEVKFQINAVEKASINSSGLFTSTTIDATALTTVPVNKGGTGATTHTANNVLVGNGTSAIGSVAPSTSGNVLTSNGSSWASTAPAAGGKVLQALSTGVTAATATSTSASWVDISGMSVSITPSASTSKVFVIAQISFNAQNHNALRIVRNDGSADTGVGVGALVGARYGAGTGGTYNNAEANTQRNITLTVLDNPPASAAYTYKVQWCTNGTMYLNRNNNNHNNGGGTTQSGRDAHSYSAITVFEVGA